MGMFLRRGTAPHGTRMSDLDVGRSIKLNLNGTPWDWLVVHQGLPSDMYDESCNGTWLLLKDCYESREWTNSSNNILENSTIHSYLNGDFLNLFDDNVKSTIKQVKIPYRSGGGEGIDQSGANGLSTKIFLLSGYEVGFTTSDNGHFPVDGAKLGYFEPGGRTNANKKRIAYMDRTATYWWLRSQHTGSTNYVWFIRDRGSENYYTPSNSYGIRPAIILPSNFILTDDMLA